MDPRFTSEVSIFVDPPHIKGESEFGLLPGIQLATGYIGISLFILFWDAETAFDIVMLSFAGAFVLLAVVINSVLVHRVGDSVPPERFHSIGLVNTFIGKTISSGWFRGVVVLFNVLLVGIFAASFVIGSQLEAAWGCFSGHLPISRLTAVVCTINASPEICWDVTNGRGTGESCTGTRHPNVQWGEWGPIGLFVIEWTIVTMLRYKHGRDDSKKIS